MEDYLNGVNDIVQGVNVVVDISDYNQMIIDQNELDNLLNLLFNSATLGAMDQEICFSSYQLRDYLKAVYPNRYAKCIKRLKEQK